MSTSKLLINESPLQVLPSLAVLVGLNEAIILQQLHYWLGRSENRRVGEDGKERAWVYNTYEQWQEQFPFWSISTIRRALKKLKDGHYIITGNFNKLPLDKTRWYTIDYEKLEEASRSVDLNSPSVQNEQSSCPEWTDDVVNLNRAIPETTTETTTEITRVLPSEGANAPPARGNGASLPLGDFLPTNLEGWLVQINSPPKGSNVNAQLRLMYQTLFPDNPLPSFGRIGTTAKRVGGPGRLGQLMWEAATKRPVGCVLDYIEATEKARKRRNGQRQPAGRHIRF